eukprot:CAMPEP_0206501208 /NCGR_PEP_ID=MMETSP0324_2-20121206/53162_1 /ASSEMBLY_ACC=CAM_ASM_000836 /TAXON_ID=2866 /ORGANISM="Crypthecodinium cohnii, Strain Seligo" /LENGTH=87 /DNA_ID=CAMNT_0053988961 /DNA_START=354 /DNA_END=614 /DNA_ORIENTATION=+
MTVGQGPRMWGGSKSDAIPCVRKAPGGRGRDLSRDVGVRSSGPLIGTPAIKAVQRKSPESLGMVGIGGWKPPRRAPGGEGRSPADSV